MKLLLMIFLWSPRPRFLPQAAEIVILHDGSHKQFESSMEWPQRLTMVFRELNFRVPDFQLTETTSLLYLKRFGVGDQRKLLGLITMARYGRSDTFQSVAKRMFPRVPILQIDTEYCHEPERLLITWLKNSLSWIYGDIKNPRTLKFTGVLSMHMESVARALNYTFVLVIPEDQKIGTKTSNGSWDGLFGLITNKFLRERYEVVDFIFAGYDNTFAFVIPPPDVERNWLASSQPYHYKVWICMAGSLIVLGLVAEFSNYAQVKQNRLTRKSWLQHVFNYLRILLNQGGDSTINHAPSRLLVGVWCIFALIAINLYTSVLVGYLSFPRLKPLVKSLEELAQSNQVRMMFFSNSALNTIFTNPNATGDVAIIAGRSRHHPEDYVKNSETAVDEVATKGSRVYLDSLPYVHGSLALDYQKHGFCRVSMVRFNFFTVPASYGVPKGSPYWHFLYNARARVVEVGIFQQISKKLLQHSPCVDMMGIAPSSARLKLADLWSPYILAFIGIGFAFFCFLLEIVSKRVFDNLS